MAGGGVLSEPLVATAYYAYSTQLFAQIADILGRTEDAQLYKSRFEKIKTIYNKYFIQDNGEIESDRQAPNARSLAFGLVNEDKKQAVADKLAQIVREKDYHLNTGFLSTPFLLPMLASYGHTDVAYKLLEQDTCPSWLYAITKGSTTIWESWNGIAPDGTLTHAKAQYESFYGTIKSSWEKVDDGILYSFTVPVNTTATVMLPGCQCALDMVTEQFKDAQVQNDRIVFNVGSGSYQVMI